MPLFGNNAGAGKAGLFQRCCLATGRLTTTWQSDRQLCTINAAMCSLIKKIKKKNNKRGGVYGLKKQTNKKPLCNCLLIIKGERPRQSSIQTPQGWGSPSRTPGTLEHSAAFRSAGHLLWSTSSSSTAEATALQGTGRAGHEQELPEVLTKDSM